MTLFIMKIVLDFETQSACDLKKHGTEVYARHPSTDVLCLVYKFISKRGSKQCLWTREDVLWPHDLYDAVLNTDCMFVAHNAAFEQGIWRYVMERKYGAPSIPLKRWQCSAAQARAVRLPGALEAAGEAMKLSIVKDWTAHRVMLKLSQPRKPTQANPTDKFHYEKDNPKWYDILYRYCGRDVEAEELLEKSIPPQTHRERMVWLLDQKINERGIPIDRDLVKQAIALYKEQEKRLVAELNKLTGGYVTTGGQRDRILFWLQDAGLNIENLQAKTLLAELKKDHPKKVLRVMEIRKELGLASVKKMQALLDRANEDDRVRGALIYHGAGPGRWTSFGIQIHNFPSQNLVVPREEIETAISLVRHGDIDVIDICYGGLSKTLSSLLRPMIKAPPGRKFIIGDYTSIEAIVAGWIAGEVGLVEDFRNKVDVYSKLASSIYGKPINKKDNPYERQLGKIAQLGCQYGMGGKTFRKQCADKNVDIDMRFAKRVVDTYRDVHQKIRNYWYALYDAAIGALQRRTVTKVRGAEFEKRGRFLFMKVPSGRELAYLDPVVAIEDTPFGRKPQFSYMGTNTYTRKWERIRTYGGRLFENLIQGTARDVMVVGMFNCERSNYPIFLTVHDEIGSEVAEDYGSCEEMARLMCVGARWTKGLPIFAEVAEVKRYCKL